MYLNILQLSTSYSKDVLTQAIIVELRYSHRSLECIWYHGTELDEFAKSVNAWWMFDASLLLWMEFLRLVQASWMMHITWLCISVWDVSSILCSVLNRKHLWNITYPHIKMIHLTILSSSVIILSSCIGIWRLCLHWQIVHCSWNTFACR